VVNLFISDKTHPPLITATDSSTTLNGVSHHHHPVQLTAIFPTNLSVESFQPTSQTMMFKSFTWLFFTKISVKQALNIVSNLVDAEIATLLASVSRAL
jgi:hypothetical protein